VYCSTNAVLNLLNEWIANLLLPFFVIGMSKSLVVLVFLVVVTDDLNDTRDETGTNNAPRNITAQTLVEVDNLSRDERIAKRNRKRRESKHEFVRAPQNNVAGSEGLLIAVRRRGPFEAPIWETTFYKTGTHRILTVVLKTNPKEYLIVHNIYAPNSYQEYERFIEELNKHIAKIAGIYKDSHLTTIIAGDFNATVSQSEHNFAEEEPYSPGKNQLFLTGLLDKHKMFSVKEKREKSPEYQTLQK